MSTDEYPYKPSEVIETLADLYRHQGNDPMAALLSSAEASVVYESYDRWDGGQYYYSLHLKIPRKQFAKVESQIESLQNSLAAKLETVFKDTAPHYLRGVVITPVVKTEGGENRSPVSHDTVERIWGTEGFRLFLSHVSQHKGKVGELKLALSVYGVSAFVAHEDIQPTQDWQAEIESALNSMQALVAIVTPEFKDSLWTDQEVGYALGRGIKTISIRIGKLPHGLLARQQALSGSFEDIRALAKKIVVVLLTDTQTHGLMRDALVYALAKSSSYPNTQLIVSQLERLESFSASNLETIEAAVAGNSQVSEAYNVPEKLRKLLSKHRPEPKDDLPF